MSWLCDTHGDQIVRVTPAQVYRLLVCFVISVLPQLANIPVWLAVTTGVLILWRVQIEMQGHPLPSNIVKLLLGFALFLGVYVEKQTLAGKDAGTALMVGLIAIKFLELRGRRDYMVLTFVLYFMGMTALLFEQSMSVFVYVIIVCSLLTVNLVGLHLPASEATQSASFFTLRMLLQSLPLAVILFLFFPRMDATLGLNLGGESTGLPRSIRAGSFDSLTENNAMAFRADFAGNPPPQSPDLYWRGFVLGNYNAATNEWTESQYLMEANLSRNLQGGQVVEQHITLRPHAKRWLFALDYPIDDTWNGQAELRSGYVLQISRSEELRRKIQYVVYSSIGSHPTTLSPAMEKSSLLITGEDQINRKVKDLARSLRPPGATDMQAVTNALAYFRSNNFSYTTKAENYGSDPLYEFLFVKRRGFCEHYASAFGVLMRLAKVPTRLVAGYQGGEYNPYGNFIVVRQLNAHAWAEVFIKGVGWTRIDPTTMAAPSDASPASPNAATPNNKPETRQPILSRFENKLTPDWIKRLSTECRYRWQLVEEIWDYWILSYNPEFQAELLKKFRLQSFAWELFILSTATAFIATVVMVARSLRWKVTPEDQLQQIYNEFCATLEEAGVVRQDWEGPAKYAARAAKVLDHAAQPIKKFSRDYAFLRYGRIRHLEPALEPLREKLVLVREALAQPETKTQP